MTEPITVFEIPSGLIFEVLEVLRLAHIYVLKDSHPDELGSDFKPWKWDGYETEFAEKASGCYRQMIEVASKTMSQRSGGSDGTDS